jgi:hypothetical protein
MLADSTDEVYGIMPYTPMKMRPESDVGTPQNTHFHVSIASYALRWTIR